MPRYRIPSHLHYFSRDQETSTNVSEPSEWWAESGLTEHELDETLAATLNKKIGYLLA